MRVQINKRYIVWWKKRGRKIKRPFKPHEIGVVYGVDKETAMLKAKREFRWDDGDVFELEQSSRTVVVDAKDGFMCYDGAPEVKITVSFDHAEAHHNGDLLSLLTWAEILKEPTDV